MRLALHLLVCSTTAILLTACGGGPSQPAQPAATGPVDDVSYWDGDGLTGRPRVIIRLDEQIAYFFIGDKLAGRARVATGKEGFGTPAGEYKILEKVQDKHSTLYGQIVDADGNVVVGDADIRIHKVPPGGQFLHAPMPYWMRLTWRGVGMHAGIIPMPGEPASHGCIRIPKEMAAIFFENVEIGTPVRIVR